MSSFSFRVCVCERPLGASGAAADGGVCVCEWVCVRVCLCVSLQSFPAWTLRWQHLRRRVYGGAALWDVTSGATWLDLCRLSFLLFFPSSSSFFYHSGSRTHQRIYEKTHVDLCDHCKPEGMPIFFVKLTLLLSLIARTRGEWLAAILQENNATFFFLMRNETLRAKKIELSLNLLRSLGW